MSIKIDNMLTGGNRRLFANPEKMLLGCTGKRLWADVLDPRPGFCGCIDFIHKINIPVLFDISCEGIADYLTADIVWQPSHLHIRAEKNGISLTEDKFILWEDIAVSCVGVFNSSPKTITLNVSPGTEDGTFKTTYGRTIRAAFFVNGRPFEGSISLSIPPMEERSLCVGAALVLDHEEDRLNSALAFAAGKLTGPVEALSYQKEIYQKWFDPAPSFTSDDALTDRTFAYRWYILRSCVMQPECGFLGGPFLGEGRSHKMTKTPYHPEGWEFTKYIPLSVPMHFLEMRWYPDPAICRGIAAQMAECQDEAGEYLTSWVDHRGNPYANFFAYAVLQHYLVTGDRELLEGILPSLKKQLAGWKERYGNESDHLLTQYIHQLTGMEYQPSFWYFHDFPDDVRDPATYTPVKRVDRNVYYYMNARSVSSICELLGDGDAGKYAGLASGIRSDILSLMWDEESGYFYDLHYQTNEKAFVKNLPGVFPFFDDTLAQDCHRRALECLFSDEFSTPYPFPSVSTKCAVFAPEGGWKGNFFKGRNGCIWNGPTWPFSNSIVLDLLGRYSLAHDYSLEEKFAEYFRKFTMLHYAGGDGKLPFLVEHYNSMTGECLSNEVDYNHSYYIDLVIRYVAGLRVLGDKIVADPLDIGLSNFNLSDVMIRGHRCSIEYSRHNDCLRLTADGKTFTGSMHNRIEVPLNALQETQ